MKILYLNGWFRSTPIQRTPGRYPSTLQCCHWCFGPPAEWLSHTNRGDHVTSRNHGDARLGSFSLCLSEAESLTDSGKPCLGKINIEENIEAYWGIYFDLIRILPLAIDEGDILKFV